jgi:hypothetical protein
MTALFGLRVIESPHVPPGVLYMLLADSVVFPSGFTASATATGWRFEYFLRIRDCAAIRWSEA